MLTRLESERGIKPSASSTLVSAARQELQVAMLPRPENGQGIKPFTSSTLVLAAYGNIYMQN